MTKSKKNPEVNTYLNNAKQWQDIMEKLRSILLECELTEEIKWDKPTYSFEKHPLVIIQGFKKYCALLFMKGVLIDDGKGILIKTGVNTRVGRQIRFTNASEVIKMKAAVKTYIKKAIAAEKKGLKVDKTTNTKLTIPEEFQNKLNRDPVLKAAFNALTPGRQRGYIFFFSAPKQSKTREARIEKYTDQILDGIGLNDYNK
jgi:uncharacterized protein YdeI (YjbR/CyaY-like superfamily)